LKSNKDRQIETIKVEIVREGLTPEQAQAAKEALMNVPEVEDPIEQAELLLLALSEVLASPSSSEELRVQMAQVVMGAAAELGLTLERELEDRDAASGVRADLLDTAAAGLANQSVPVTVVLEAVSRQLLAEPGATVDTVADLVSGLASAVGLPSDEVRELVLLEDLKIEASRLCVDPSDVVVGKEFFCADGSKRVGTFSVPAPPPPCTEDGVVGCVTTAAFRPAAVALLPSQVVLGQIVAGAVGTVRIPDPEDVRLGQSFGILDAIEGTYAPDFPDVASVLASDTTNGVAGTVVLPPAAAVLVGTDYGPSSATSGAYTPDFPDPSNVRSVDTTNGIAGTYVPDFPDPSNVRSSDTVNGTSGTLSDCTVDGDEGCVVPQSGAIKAADTTHLTEWDIRRKRAPDGSLITFAGLEGRSKQCRNRANLTDGPDATNTSDADLPYNNTVAPALGTLVPDPYDTISDSNDFELGLPPNPVPWQIPGVAGNHGSDFTCGGIFATGSISVGPTGADSSLNHDPVGNWQDLTPGIVPGGAASTIPTAGCNSADKFCVFRDLISGMMVTEVAAGLYTWEGAITYCHNLGKFGDPIPTLETGLSQGHSDWRLPTQKELTHLANASILGLNQTTTLLNSFGNLSTGFWTATSLSGSTGAAWRVGLHFGQVATTAKTSSFSVVCVR
jgi:hypothetical protein